MGLQSPELERASEFELLDQALQQSVASLEQALQQVRLEQRLLQHNRSMSSETGLLQNHQHKENGNLWVDPSPEARGAAASAAPGFQLGPSLFFFGDGGLPLPISPPDDRSDADTSNCIFLDTSTPCTPFDFPHCDFLRESLPNFSWAAKELPGECNLYEVASPLREDANDSLCIVCLEHPASVNLVVPCLLYPPSITTYSMLYRPFSICYSAHSQWTSTICAILTRSGVDSIALLCCKSYPCNCSLLPY